MVLLLLNEIRYPNSSIPFYLVWRVVLLNFSNNMLKLTGIKVSIVEIIINFVLMVKKCGRFVNDEIGRRDEGSGDSTVCGSERWVMGANTYFVKKR